MCVNMCQTDADCLKWEHCTGPEPGLNNIGEQTPAFICMGNPCNDAADCESMVCDYGMCASCVEGWYGSEYICPVGSSYEN